MSNTVKELIISCTACKGTKFEVIWSTGISGHDRQVKLICECGLTFPLMGKKKIERMKLS